MMTNPRQLRTLRLGLRVSAATGAVALAMVFALTVVASQAAQAQTFKVIHNFTGGLDGSFPLAGVTMDRAGNLYGTASSGGNGSGTVYRLKRQGSNWLVQPLYSFKQSDGAFPEARVIFGPDGTLYGTTTYGGAANQVTVFRLRPPAAVCKTAICPWRPQSKNGAHIRGASIGRRAVESAVRAEDHAGFWKSPVALLKAIKWLN